MKNGGNMRVKEALHHLINNDKGEIVFNNAKCLPRTLAEVPDIKSAGTGVKHDQEKPDLSLLPRDFLDEVAKAMQHGERKYGRYNYRGGMSWHRIVAAAMRHITAWNDGEDTDKESGVSHLGHAGACILMLCVLVKNKKGEDTRCKS
jgi:hypothetical protein